MMMRDSNYSAPTLELVTMIFNGMTTDAAA